MPTPDKGLRPAIILNVANCGVIALLGTSDGGRFNREPYYSVCPPDTNEVRRASAFGLQTDKPTYFDEFTVAYPRRRFMQWSASVGVPARLAYRLMNALFSAAKAGDIQVAPPPWSKDDRTDQERADGEALLATLVPPDVGRQFDKPSEVAEPDAGIAVAVAMLGPSTGDGSGEETC